MSVNWHIGCVQCKVSVWIGQGSQSSFADGIDGRFLYTGEDATMLSLRNFLFNHRGHSLVFNDDETMYGNGFVQEVDQAREP